jgi:hypothetical protein
MHGATIKKTEYHFGSQSRYKRIFVLKKEEKEEEEVEEDDYESFDKKTVYSNE